MLLMSEVPMCMYGLATSEREMRVLIRNPYHRGTSLIRKRQTPRNKDHKRARFIVLL